MSRRRLREGIRRLSLAVGGLTVLLVAWRQGWDRWPSDWKVPWYFIALSRSRSGYDYYGINVIPFAFISTISFFSGWFAVRVIGWVLTGFMGDSSDDQRDEVS
jgi:hypothetical protein